MDDLQRAAARSRSVREAEAQRARTLVDEEVQRFDRWLASLDVVPTIAALRERGDEIVEAVLAENETRWESLSEADRERLRVMARAIVERMLHEPTLRLKGAAEADESSRATCRRCASCSAWRRPAPDARGRAARRGGHRPRVAPPQRARRDGWAPAAARSRWRRRRWWPPRSETGVEIVEITTCGDRGLGAGRTRRASSRRSRTRCCAARSTWRCTPPRTCPASCPTGLAIAGVPERADPRDALCGADSIAALPEGAMVGTASLRRRSQLLALRPDLDVREVRGNVDTRLRQAGGRRVRRARAGRRRPGAPGAVRGRADPRGAR